MSTLKNNVTAKRFALLAKQGETVFHIQDLAGLWLMTNRNTLRINLRRYVKSGVLYRVYRGLYSLLPPQEVDPVLLGMRALHQFCYLSTESILFREGYISHKVYAYTFVGLQSRHFEAAGHSYRCRKLAKRYLYQNVGIEQHNGILAATPERAIADLLYYNPRYHFDRPVDWKKISKLQQAIGYPVRKGQCE